MLDALQLKMRGDEETNKVYRAREAWEFFAVAEGVSDETALRDFVMEGRRLLREQKNKP